MTHLNTMSFVWSIADLLRGPYKQSEYGKVILPLAALFRLDAVLAPTKAAVLEVVQRFGAQGVKPPEDLLRLASGLSFYNTSPLALADVLGNPEGLRKDLEAYIGAFSDNVRDIFERYDTLKQIQLLEDRELLFKVLKRFGAVDLSPSNVDNRQMGLLFEELIRRFAELSNETAGEHYTAREVIQLMVSLLFTEDDEVLSKPGVVRSVYDPTAGAGGMLAVSDEFVAQHNPGAKLVLFGQELNDESYAICKADLLIKGHAADNIKQGNTLKKDLHFGQTFDYVLSNPPFGVDWESADEEVRDEHKLGKAGRFGPGLPRKNDGAMLFLMHALSKLAPRKKDGTGGGRLGIVLPGGPMFIGGPGSGESEIRRHVLENDLLEAIVALPGDLFYNTPLSTYVWVITNRKADHRKGQVQLINASGLSRKMKKSLGNKRVEIGEDDIARIVREHGNFAESDLSRVLPNAAFGYRTVTVERPLRRIYQITDERLDLLDADAKLAALPNLEDIKAALRQKVGTQTFTSQGAFLGYVELALKSLGLKKPQLKAIAELMGVRDEHGEISLNAKGQPIADPDLRDTEDVPLTETVEAYLQREVLPYAPDAWVSEDEKHCDPKDGLPGKMGYEIPFNKYFYVYQPPRPLEQIDGELKALSAEVMELLAEVVR